MRVAIVTSAGSREALQVLLDCVQSLDALYLVHNPQTPLLYESGIAYAKEPVQTAGADANDTAEREERFATIPEVLAQGWGDCDDLAPWRAAELTLQGCPSRAMIYEVAPKRWHVVVVRGDGVTEDPSAVLGMLDRAATAARSARVSKALKERARGVQ